MERIPEAELMDEAEQARAYAEADFSEPNSLFISEFRNRFPDATPSRVIDLGCGPGDISIRFAQAFPGTQIIGIDGAETMLQYAREMSEKASLNDRVDFICDRIQSHESDSQFDVVLSNSLLHHLHDPADLWNAIKRLATIGATVLVMDLMRPDSEAIANRLVDTYAADEPEILRRDFFNSLRAAFSIDEVESQLKIAGIESLVVEAVSDRHLLVSGRLVD